VSRLARDVVTRFEMLTGEKIGLCFDRGNIAWGEDWHNNVRCAVLPCGLGATPNGRVGVDPRCACARQRANVLLAMLHDGEVYKEQMSSMA
jgi:hypothetical protein